MAFDRMSLLLQQERAEANDQMLAGIRDEILEVLERRTQVPAERIEVRLGRVSGTNRLEIDMKLPGGRHRQAPAGRPA